MAVCFLEELVMKDVLVKTRKKMRAKEVPQTRVISTNNRGITVDEMRVLAEQIIEKYRPAFEELAK
jgi:hypothetical protein